MVANGTAGPRRLVAQGPGAPEVHRPGHRSPDSGADDRRDRPRRAVLGGREHDGGQPSQARVHVPRLGPARARSSIDLKDPWNPQSSASSRTSQGHTRDLPQRLPLHLAGRRRAGRADAGQASSVSVTDIRDPMHPFTYPTSSRPTSAARPRRAARRTPSTSTSTASPGSPARRRPRLVDRGPAQGPGHRPGPLRDAVRPDPLRRRLGRRRQRQLVHAQRLPRAAGARRPGRPAT